MEVAEGLPVPATEGFLAHAVSENVYAGATMNRRATYRYGTALPRGERGQVGAGLGPALATGVRMVFQLTPGTKDPAELNNRFPDRAALCMAENATHNPLRLRGCPTRACGPRS